MTWKKNKLNKSQQRQYRKNYYRNWYLKNGRSRPIDYAEATFEWKKNHPEAYKAHITVYRALKSGKLVKPKTCADCLQERRLSAHHEDYTKPLEVDWLCSSCHKLRHLIPIS
jgi:hypothetical protein